MHIINSNDEYYLVVPPSEYVGLFTPVTSEPIAPT